MKVLHYLERIEMIHKLVDQERTGTPVEFARRLGISRTRLYEIMDDLKLEGAPIAYSRSCRTFYYEEPFQISISFELRPLDRDDNLKVNGGQPLTLSTFHNTMVARRRILSIFINTNAENLKFL